jgi:hypothetical protein
MVSAFTITTVPPPARIFSTMLKPPSVRPSTSSGRTDC